MKAIQFYTLSAALLAATLIQTGCSKSETSVAPAAATPAPAAKPAATTAAPAPAAATATTPDFGDMSSAVLVGKTWAALKDKDYDLAIVYAQKCIDTYKTQALEQQKALTAEPTEKADIEKQWALNDVGTASFQLGSAYDAQKGKRKDALAAFQSTVDNYGYAHCWDPKGWYWKPSAAAAGKIKELSVPD